MVVAAHVDCGGRYYSFDAPNGERLTLLRNLDVFDLAPFADGFDDWPVVLFIDEAEEGSLIIQRLLQRPEHLREASAQPAEMM